MLDLKHTLRSVPETKELHVVAVQSEVKELLLSIDLAASPSSYQDVPLVVSLLGGGQEQSLRFERAFAEEEAFTARYATELGRWLYLPHAMLMKAGLYKSLAARYGLEPLHVSSHLYTSDEACPDFPGRRYEVDEVLPFSSSLLRRLAKERLAAQIICRNFPLSADVVASRQPSTTPAPSSALPSPRAKPSSSAAAAASRPPAHAARCLPTIKPLAPSISSDRWGERLLSFA